MNQPAKIAEIDQKMSHDIQRVLVADKDELFQVMQESGGEVLLAALRNRSLDENHLLALLKRRGLPEEIFTTLHSGRRFSESNPLKFALASHPETPSHIASSLLPQLYIFDLIKLCSMPGITPDQRLYAERIIIQRLPTQPLGNKLTLARRGSATIVEALLREGLPPVVDACLDNPHLKEGGGSPVHRLRGVKRRNHLHDRPERPLEGQAQHPPSDPQKPPYTGHLVYAVPAGAPRRHVAGTALSTAPDERPEGTGPASPERQKGCKA